MSAAGSGPGGPPVSFKTNVNRQKTKRWVEAKSYNYDGDDWGDVDDYDEYGAHEEPQPAKPTGLRQAGQAVNRTSSMPVEPQRNDPRFAGQPPQAAYARPPHERSNSYERGDDRRAVSGPGPSSPPPLRTAYGQPPSQDQQRPSGREPQPAAYRASSMGQPLAPADGYRAQSITSNTSADLHGRRDISSSSAAPPPLRTPQNPPRKSSMGQQDAPSPVAGYRGDLYAAASSSSNPAPALPPPGRDRADSKGSAFIRPADIYRRMQEEKEKQRLSQDSSRPSLDVARPPSRSPARDPSPAKSGDESDGSRRPRQPLAPVAERQSEYGMEGVLSSTSTQAFSQTRGTNRSPVLPEVLGLGDGFGAEFGSSFLSVGDAVTGSSLVQPSPESAISQVPGSGESASVQPTALQHAPSQGFRSAVHTAFDQPAVPETPSSASGSNLGRSGSESTSAISPIISRGPSDAHPGPPSLDTQAQTTHFASIAEEQSPDTPRQGAASSAPASRGRPATTERPASFIPGHRRDMSTPSPDNSPARKPAVESIRPLRQPQVVELASPSAAESLVGEPEPVPFAQNVAGGSAPSSRAESPTKGRVRELAERLNSGSNSRRGSREGSIDDGEGGAQPSSRPTSSRLESFRPSLPGGWNSYTTNDVIPPSNAQSPMISAEDARDTSKTSSPAVQEQHSASPEPTTDATPKGNPGMTLPQSGLALSAGTSNSSIIPTPQGMGDGHDLSKDAEYFTANPLSGAGRSQDLVIDQNATTPTRTTAPAMSTESSPNDQESDRLRKQLVRELSPSMKLLRSRYLYKSLQRTSL